MSHPFEATSWLCVWVWKKYKHLLWILNNVFFSLQLLDHKRTWCHLLVPTKRWRGTFFENVINTDKRHFSQRKMWNPMGHHVSFRVIAPEKDVNSVNMTNHEWICANKWGYQRPWVSIGLLRFRGKVPSSLEMVSGVLKISSSLSCSSFSCWMNTQQQNQV